MDDLLQRPAAVSSHERFDAVREAVNHPEMHEAQLAAGGRQVGERALAEIEQALAHCSPVFAPVVRLLREHTNGKHEFEAAVIGLCEKAVDRMAELSKSGAADKATALLGGLANLVRRSATSGTHFDGGNAYIEDWAPMFFTGLRHALESGAALDIGAKPRCNLFDFTVSTLARCSGPGTSVAFQAGSLAAESFVRFLPFDEQGPARGRLQRIDHEARALIADREIPRQMAAEPG